MFSLKNIFLNIYKSLIALLLIFVVIVFANLKTAKADEVDITTSFVMDDLASKGIDYKDYLSSEENEFITMVQYYDLENNLRTYVYLNLIDPYSLSSDLRIEISTATANANDVIEESYQLYKLKYVNYESTFYKYEVLGLNNLVYTTRRYKINSIGVLPEYATYNGSLKVDELYVFNGISNNTIKVFHEEVETITITDKEVDFWCYGDDDYWSEFWGYDGRLEIDSKYTDAWYIFFNTDKQIDELLEIELTYQKYNYKFVYPRMEPYIKFDFEFTEKFLNDFINEYEYYGKQMEINFSEQVVDVIKPGNKTIASSDKDWFGRYTTTYETLENIIDLRKYKVEIGDEFVFTEQANKYTWAVHFLDTEKYDTCPDGSISNIYGSGISNTAILRLRFKVGGIEKNCYAIDVPTDDFNGNIADTEINSFEDLFEKMTQLISLVVMLILLVLCLPVITTFFSALVKFIKLIFEIIIYIITLPFRVILSIFGGKEL